MENWIKELNDEKFFQDEICLEECSNFDYDELFADSTILAEGLEPEKHRWYETAIRVISVGGKVLGIRHITTLYSESMTTEDCYHILEFFEMKEVKTITYVKI